MHGLLTKLEVPLSQSSHKSAKAAERAINNTVFYAALPTNSPYSHNVLGIWANCGGRIKNSGLQLQSQRKDEGGKGGGAVIELITLKGI